MRTLAAGLGRLPREHQHVECYQRQRQADGRTPKNCPLTRQSPAPTDSTGEWGVDPRDDDVTGALEATGCEGSPDHDLRRLGRLLTLSCRSVTVISWVCLLAAGSTAVGTLI